MKEVKNALEKREQNDVPTETLINIAGFVLENKFLSLMVPLNNKFQERPLVPNVLPPTPQQRTPLVWFRYVDEIFSIWTHGKEHLETFLQELES